MAEKKQEKIEAEVDANSSNKIVRFTGATTFTRRLCPKSLKDL